MTIEELKMLSVYELRMLARAMGVRSPTSKSSEQMINEIIAIENGKLEPFKTKKGRPPKSKGTNLDGLKQFLNSSSIMPSNYEPVKMVANYDFCSNSVNTSSGTHKFKGVVRRADNFLYVQDYLSSNEYVIISNDGEVREGDIVQGTAIDFEANFKKAKSFEKIEFKHNNQNCEKKAIKEFNTNQEMSEYVNSQSGNKLIVEVETANFVKPNAENNVLFLHSNRCDDVLKTYNMLLDVKNCIKSLCEKQEQFTLYLMDVEYIYYMLTLYFQYRNVAIDINAGQYFKELFNSIATNKNAGIVILKKANCSKSSYLELIIDRYLN